MTHNSPRLRFFNIMMTLGLVGLIWGYFGASPALAVGFPNNLIFDTTSNADTGGGFFQEFGGGFSGNLKNFQIKEQATSATNIIVRFYEDTFPPPGHSTLWSFWPTDDCTDYGDRATWPVGTNMTDVLVDFESLYYSKELGACSHGAFPLDDTKYYSIGTSWTAVGMDFYIAGSSTDEIPGVCKRNNDSSPCTPVSDIYIAADYVAPHLEPVITAPVNEEILTESPAVWFEGTCDSTNGYNTINVELTDLEDNLVALTSGVCLPADSTSGSFDTGAISGMILFLGNGTYQARPVSIGPSGEPYIFGDLISFTVAVPDNPNPGLPVVPPPPEDCSAAATITEQATCWLTQKFGDLLKFLFVPSDQSFKIFLTLWSPILTKAPLGYITSVITAFGSLSSGGTPTFTISSMAALSSLITPLDTILGAILWLFIAFWLFRRIAKMEL